MINTALTLGVFGRLGILLCLSLVMTGCGFNLQGQSYSSFPTHLNIYVDDPLLESVVSQNLAQHDVVLNTLDSVVEADVSPLISEFTQVSLQAPVLQLTRTLKNRAELILDNNGDALIWRYTLSTHYLFLAQGMQPDSTQNLAVEASLPLSVSTDVDVSGAHATINARIEADSWALLYQQLGTRITYQLSFE
tara:strand:+ start:2925 stop:3500 length:576 start_codon:yes stop_codon:yes gene_type:complete